MTEVTAKKHWSVAWIMAGAIVVLLAALIGSRPIS
jgi:hypothetical protein